MSLDLRRRVVPLAGISAVVFLILTISLADALETVRVSGTGSSLAGIERVADAFMRRHPGVKVILMPSLGSSGSIQAVLAGKLDLGVSARPLTGQERARGGRQTAYARTAFVFGVGRSTAAKDITLEALVRIYNGTTSAWADGTPVRLILRPPRDTDTILQKAISPKMAQAVDAAHSRPGMVLEMTDPEAADAIERTRGSIGTTTLAMIASEGRDIVPLTVDGVAPSVENARNGSYPYTKTFFLIEGPGPSPAARRFADFLRSREAMAVLSPLGHVPVR